MRPALANVGWRVMLQCDVMSCGETCIRISSRSGLAARQDQTANAGLIGSILTAESISNEMLHVHTDMRFFELLVLQ